MKAKYLLIPVLGVVLVSCDTTTTETRKTTTTTTETRGVTGVTGARTGYYARSTTTYDIDSDRNMDSRINGRYNRVVDSSFNTSGVTGATGAKNGSYYRNTNGYYNRGLTGATGSNGAYRRPYDADNTGINARDRNNALPTADNQSNLESDRIITRRIRELIIDDDTLSTNAKNVKIITIQGVVTLRGPVNSESERRAIEAKLRNLEGVSNINNNLEVISRR